MKNAEKIPDLFWGPTTKISDNILMESFLDYLYLVLMK